MHEAYRERWNFSLNEQYPLHSAAITGNRDLLHHLLELGYQLVDVDDHGNTPLHCAASEGHIDIIHYILNYKKCRIVLNLINFKGLTPLAVACAEGQLDCALKLLKSRCKVNHKYERSSALHEAVASDSVDCVELLLNYRCAVNKLNEYGETALHVALRALRIDRMPDSLTLENSECINLLVSKGTTHRFPVSIFIGISY